MDLRSQNAKAEQTLSDLDDVTLGSPAVCEEVDSATSTMERDH